MKNLINDKKKIIKLGMIFGIILFVLVLEYIYDSNFFWGRHYIGEIDNSLLYRIRTVLSFILEYVLTPSLLFIILKTKWGDKNNRKINNIFSYIFLGISIYLLVSYLSYIGDINTSFNSILNYIIILLSNTLLYFYLFITLNDHIKNYTYKLNNKVLFYIVFSLIIARTLISTGGRIIYLLLGSFTLIEELLSIRYGYLNFIDINKKVKKTEYEKFHKNLLERKNKISTWFKTTGKKIGIILGIIIVVIGILLGVYFLNKDIINYKYATIVAKKGNYKKAINILEDIDNEKSNKYLNELYEKYADKFIKEKEYSKAIKYLNKVNSKTKDEKINKCNYNLGLSKYEEKDIENAIKYLEKCIEYKDSKELINKYKYEYIKNILDSDKLVSDLLIDYLKDLKEIEYEDSKELYKELTKWYLDIIVTNSSYSNIDRETISKTGSLYFKFTVKGGEENEKIAISYKITYPEGDSEKGAFDDEFIEGSKGEVIIRYYNRKNAEDGECTITFYDAVSKEEIGKRSVTIY